MVILGDAVCDACEIYCIILKDVYRRPRQVQYLNQLEICHLEYAIVKFFEYPCETPVKYK